MSVTFETTTYVNLPNGYRIEKWTRTTLSGTPEEIEKEPEVQLIAVAYFGTPGLRSRVTFPLDAKEVNDDAWKEVEAKLPSAHLLWQEKVQKYMQSLQQQAVQRNLTNQILANPGRTDQEPNPPRNGRLRRDGKG